MDMREISVTTTIPILGQASKPMIYCSSEESNTITTVLSNLPLGYALKCTLRILEGNYPTQASQLMRRLSRLKQGMFKVNST